MKALFESGTVYGFIAVGMGIEALALTIYYRRTGRGVAPEAFLLNLIAGMSLVVTTLAVARGRQWWLIALCLGLALAFHLLDLRRLWRR